MRLGQSPNPYGRSLKISARAGLCSARCIIFQIIEARFHIREAGVVVFKLSARKALFHRAAQQLDRGFPIAFRIEKRALFLHPPKG